MPKAKEFDAALQYLKNKLPQLGFFSTLDEAIRAAPFDRAPAEQWQNYLKPGLSVQREGIMFPLKKEELQYSGLNDFLSEYQKSRASFDPTFTQRNLLPGSPEQISRDVLLDEIQKRRPGFGLRVGNHELNSDDWLALQRYPRTPLSSTRVEIQPAEYEKHAHTPGVPGSYEENVTTSPDFGTFPSHFSPQDISWSRTTRHYAPGALEQYQNQLHNELRDYTTREGLPFDSLDEILHNPVTPEQEAWLRDYEKRWGKPQLPTTRLIEEIQSDRHEAAAEKSFNPTTEQMKRLQDLTGFSRNSLASMSPLTRSEFSQARTPIEEEINNLLSASMQRRGYRTPEEEQLLRNPRERNPHDNYGETFDLSRKPPDTPFKDPADYALLELKKQLLNSVNQGDQYLALTRGKDQIQRYERGMGGGKGEGMSYIYDQVYPSALKKLAKQYGAEVTDVPIEVEGQALDTRPPTMVDAGEETVDDTLNSAEDGGDYVDKAKSLLDDFGHLEGSSEDYDSFLRRGYRALDRVSADIGNTAARTQLHSHLNALHSLWDMAAAEGNPNIVTAQTLPLKKTFPAMHITPEVAERVKKAGVPLFTLAGGVASGLGSDGSDANVVEDQAMQNANAGHAEGGAVFDPVRAAVERLQSYADGGEVDTPHPKQSLAEAYARQAAQPAGTDPGSSREYLDRARTRVGDVPASLLQLRAFFDKWRGSPTASTFAEGGSTDDYGSSLKWLAEQARRFGGPEHPEDRARLATGIAKQFYGLDENGNPSFLGVTGYSRRHPVDTSRATPPAIVDQVLSLPTMLAPLAELAARYASVGGHRGGAGATVQAPQWSRDATDRLARLEARVRQETGIGEAQSLPEHLEDAAGMLASPIPASKVAGEAPALQRLLEYLTPVRPPTLGRYATDTAIFGSGSAALDALAKRLAARAKEPDNSPPDTTVEDAAMENANAEHE